MHASLQNVQMVLRPHWWPCRRQSQLSCCAGAYDSGQRDFGENYVQEVTAKGPAMPEDVRWHFIGHLQTNKVKELVSVPNLHCVHTVDSLKLAAELQKRCAALRPDRPLAVLVQVNTSAEESKSGCAPRRPPISAFSCVRAAPT